MSGLNLYNNGFSGGLLAIILYPVIIDIIDHRKPELQNEDYFEIIEHEEPQIPPERTFTEEEVEYHMIWEHVNSEENHKEDQ